MPRGDDDRYAIYSVTPYAELAGVPARGSGDRRRVAETSRDGIGLCLTTLREEGELTDDSRVGILDRQTRQWIVNPWARGDA